MPATQSTLPEPFCSFTDDAIFEVADLGEIWPRNSRYLELAIEPEEPDDPADDQFKHNLALLAHRLRNAYHDFVEAYRLGETGAGRSVRAKMALHAAKATVDHYERLLRMMILSSHWVAR